MKKNIVKKAAVTTLASVLVLNALAMPQKNIGAATEHWNDASAEWTAYKNAWTGLSTNYENVSLTPGTDETKINLAWYSKTEETPKFTLTHQKQCILSAWKNSKKQSDRPCLFYHVSFLVH